MKKRWMLIAMLAAALAVGPSFAQSHDPEEKLDDDVSEGLLLAGEMDALAGEHGDMHGMGDMEGMHGRPGGPMMRGRMGHGRLLEAMQHLDLTDAQRARMREIHDRQTRAGIRARADLQIARLDLHKLLTADAPQKSAIDAQVDKIARMRADLQKSQLGALLEARSVLTPDQQKKMKEMHMGGERHVIRERIRHKIQTPGGGSQ